MRNKEPQLKHLSVPVSAYLDGEIRERMADGGFNSMAEYLRHTVREDLKHADQAKLESLLLEGLESGEPVEMTDQWMEERRQALTAQLAKRRGKKRV